MEEVESCGEMVDPIPKVDGEDAVFSALGIRTEPHHAPTQLQNSLRRMMEESYKVIPNPDADVVDLSDLRGTRAPITGAEHLGTNYFFTTKTHTWLYFDTTRLCVSLLFHRCHETRRIE